MKEKNVSSALEVNLLPKLNPERVRYLTGDLRSPYLKRNVNLDKQTPDIVRQIENYVLIGEDPL